MGNMRILLQNRTDSHKRPGGDTVHMLNVKSALQALGVAVDVDYRLNCNVNGFDVVHLFNVDNARETYLQFQNASAQNARIALTPIFHEMGDYYRRGLPGIYGTISRALPRFGRDLAR